MNLFKTLSLLTSTLALYLFFLLLFSPSIFLADVGIQGDNITDFILLRASFFMLGTALLLFFSRNLPPSKARGTISLSIFVTWAGLAFNGSYGLYAGIINRGIILPIILEITISISFLVFWISDWWVGTPIP